MASKVDFSGAVAGLQILRGPARESFARRVAVSGGRMVRNEAKLLAPKGEAEAQYTQPYGGSKNPGLLADSIYVAYDEKGSSSTNFIYSVSWNHKRAPHGHLIEFGHWQPYRVVFDKSKGQWITLKDKPRPKKIAARPFLGPAFDAVKPSLFTVMLHVAQREFPKLLAKQQAEDLIDAD